MVDQNQIDRIKALDSVLALVTADGTTRVTAPLVHGVSHETAVACGAVFLHNIDAQHCKAFYIMQMPGKLDIAVIGVYHQEETNANA